MGRTGIAPRPAACTRAGRAFTVALACLALLLCGAGEVLPRSVALAVGPAAAAAPVAQGPGGVRAGALEAPGTSLGVRGTGLAALPAPTSPGGGLPPTAGPLVAPHLVAEPQRRPPTTPPAPTTAGAPGSRAPPGPAGT